MFRVIAFLLKKLAPYRPIASIHVLLLEMFLVAKCRRKSCGRNLIPASLPALATIILAPYI